MGTLIFFYFMWDDFITASYVKKRMKLDLYQSSTLTSFKEPGIYNFLMSKMIGLLPLNFRFLCGAVILSILIREALKKTSHSHLNGKVLLCFGEPA